MKVLLIVRREPGTEDVAWVVAAADEYTLDEWNGTPDFIQKELNTDPANTRELWVTLPDDALIRPFVVPEVDGEPS